MTGSARRGLLSKRARVAGRLALRGSHWRSPSPVQNIAAHSLFDVIFPGIAGGAGLQRQFAVSKEDRA